MNKYELSKILLKKEKDTYFFNFEDPNHFVNDVIKLCYIRENLGKIHITYRNDSIIENDTDLVTNKNIVFLLESPHKDEFEYEYEYTTDNGYQINNMIAFKPAEGSTGVNFNNYFLNIINEIFKQSENEDGNYNIIISNPIEIQTSLYFLHQNPIGSEKSIYNNLRNDVWSKVWNVYSGKEKVIQNQFYQKIQSYNPYIIVNCCTKYLSHTFLNTFLKTNFKNIKLYKTNHPSGWFSYKNRNVEII